MRVWSWRRRLAVAAILILFVGLAALAVWQFERHGVESLVVIGLSLIVIGTGSTILHLTASDDFLRRHFGEASVAPRRRALRSGVVSVLLGALILGVQYGFDYFEQRTAEALTRRGKAHLQDKEYPEAVEDFSKAIEFDPKSAEAYHGRGIAHLQLGEPERAVADLSESLRLNPSDPQVVYNRGVTYSRMGDHDRALADFGEAIRLNPRFARAYLARSRVYAKMGDDANADADRQKAFELDPSLKKDRDGTMVRRSLNELVSSQPIDC
jgi:tetratricopeptide (TPR) repeat protein